MPARSECPACHKPTVDQVLIARAVDYYRCTVCYHVWTLPRGANEPVFHITPLRVWASVQPKPNG